MTDNSPIVSRSNSADNLYLLNENIERSHCNCSLTNLVLTIIAVAGSILLAVGLVSLYAYSLPTTLPFLTKFVVSVASHLNTNLLTFCLASSGIGLILVTCATTWHSRTYHVRRREVHESIKNL